MFLVKSCESRFNVCNSNTIKIGTLHEYRETESQQLLDRKEGFYTISFNIQNQLIDINLFNLLQSPQNSDLAIYMKYSRFQGSYKNYMLATHNAQYEWRNHNRFIFCISHLAKHEDATGIFPDYDDYWYIYTFNKKKFTDILKRRFLHEVKQLLIKGQKIFNKDSVNVNNLSIKCYSQEIMYSDRHLYLDNSNIEKHTKDTIGLFKNIKFIKPIDYSHEKELRIVFDFYDGAELLIPIVKDIIIPGSISKIIKQKP